MVGPEIVTFVAVVVALLATPGPTNTLLAASGAAVGLTRSPRLLLAECAGYFLAGSASVTGASSITMARVFFTTLLNPKALILALLVFPRGTLVALAPWLAGLSVMVAIVASAWIALGAAVAHASLGSIA